jgi:hypothetical protein
MAVGADGEPVGIGDDGPGDGDAGSGGARHAVAPGLAVGSGEGEVVGSGDAAAEASGDAWGLGAAIVCASRRAPRVVVGSIRNPTAGDRASQPMAATSAAAPPLWVMGPVRRAAVRSIGIVRTIPRGVRLYHQNR